MAIGRTDDRNTPWDPTALRCRENVREPIGATHLGQRSPPTAHTGRTHDRNRPDPVTPLYPCKPGAVHTWIPAFAGNASVRWPDSWWRRSMLKGKTAIVTVSTSGIGAGIATALAGEGCAIVLNGFGDAAAIEQQRAGLAERHGVAVRYIAADMAKSAEIRHLVAEAARQLGSVDILVNN